MYLICNHYTERNLTPHDKARLETNRRSIDLTGLSVKAIMKSNIITGFPPIKRKPDGFLYVEFLDLQYWIKMEGLYELELLADEDEEADEEFNC